MEKKFYNEKIRRIIQGFVIIACIILILAIIRQINFIVQDIKNGEKPQFRVLIGNTLCLSFFSILCFYPQKISLLSLITFYYAIPITGSSDSMMWINMIILGIVVLIARGFFIKHKKIKIVLMTLIVFFFIFLNTYYSTEKKLSYIVNVLGHSFVSCSIVFFLYLVWKQPDRNEPKILNLASYSGLKEFDVELLQQVLEGKLYKQFTCPDELTRDSLRTHLSRVYKKLGVADRTGFFATYHDYKLIYDSTTAAQVNEE